MLLRTVQLRLLGTSLHFVIERYTATARLLYQEGKQLHHMPVQIGKFLQYNVAISVISLNIMLAKFSHHMYRIYHVYEEYKRR